ncbi:hypothetical protein Gotur_017695 [Gossypium turneri]
MAVYDSFIKPGAVPFKWEIRPGVPKQPQNPKQQPPLPPLPPPPPPSPFINNQRSSPNLSGPLFPPQKLKPPPAGSYLLLTSEPQTHSFRSTTRSNSERSLFDRPVQVHLECVSHGCFPSPLLRRKEERGGAKNLNPTMFLILRHCRGGWCQVGSHCHRSMPHRCLPFYLLGHRPDSWLLLNGLGSPFFMGKRKTKIELA